MIRRKKGKRIQIGRWFVRRLDGTMPGFSIYCAYSRNCAEQSKGYTVYRHFVLSISPLFNGIFTPFLSLATQLDFTFVGRVCGTPSLPTVPHVHMRRIEKRGEEARIDACGCEPFFYASIKWLRWQISGDCDGRAVLLVGCSLEQSNCFVALNKAHTHWRPKKKWMRVSLFFYIATRCCCCYCAVEMGYLYYATAQSIHCRLSTIRHLCYV